VKEHLTEANADKVLKEITKDPDSSEPDGANALPKKTSLAEDAEWLMILFNGVSNGLPNYYGAIEFAQQYSFEAAETYALAVSAFLYSSTVSMAGNYKGIQADKTCAVEMAQLRSNLGRIQNVQQFFNQVDVAIDKLNDYKNKKTSNNPLFAWNNNDAVNQLACQKMIDLLNNFKSNANANHQLILSEAEKKAIRQGELGMIYEIYARPFVELATANASKTEHQNTLSQLIQKVKTYCENRKNRSNYTFGRFGSNRKLVPCFSKNEKVPASEKLMHYLDVALSVLNGTTVTNTSLAPFTEEEKRALVDSNLGILYAQAQPYLALSEFYIKRKNSSTLITTVTV
jgi:hypothetical protein